MCLWGELGREERDDRFSFGLLGVSECMGRIFKGSIWTGVSRKRLRDDHDRWGERAFEGFGSGLSSDFAATLLGSQDTQCVGQGEEGGPGESEKGASSDLLCEEPTVSDPSLLGFLSEVPGGLPGGSEKLRVRDQRFALLLRG